jgi:hypothetical protein
MSGSIVRREAALLRAGVSPERDGRAERLWSAGPSRYLWLARAGSQLGMPFHVAGRLLDPDAVILGGRLPPHLLRSLLDAVDIGKAFWSSRTIPVPPFCLPNWALPPA